MAYRDGLPALEAKLRGLYDARRELDRAIAETLCAMRPHRRAARLVLALRIAKLLLALVVLAIGALVAFVPIVPWGQGLPSYRDVRSGVRTVASAAEMYLVENPGGRCPKVEALVSGGFLNANTRSEDAWGRPYVIHCDGTDITVTSAGPDGRFGTEDDIQ